MPGTTEAIAFTDSYKHMECLCGMRLQSFTLFTRATPGTPASIYIYIYIYMYILTVYTKILELTVYY